MNDTIKKISIVLNNKFRNDPTKKHIFQQLYDGNFQDGQSALLMNLSKKISEYGSNVIAKLRSDVEESDEQQGKLTTGNNAKGSSAQKVYCNEFILF